MRRLGGFLLVLGIGAFILPMIGMQFKLLSLFGENANMAAIVMAVVGLGIVIVAKK